MGETPGWAGARVLAVSRQQREADRRRRVPALTPGEVKDETGSPEFILRIVI